VLLLNWKALAYGSSKMLRAWRLMMPRLFANQLAHLIAAEVCTETLTLARRVERLD
jgi:hypothetical protein